MGPTGITHTVGFVHDGDPFYDRIRSDWTAMGLDALGPLTSVDSSAPPYGHTHELISSAPLPPVILATHDSTAVDSATPICPGGAPEYAPVWSYVLEVGGHMPVSAGKPHC